MSGIPIDFRVMAGDSKVVDLHDIVRQPADGDYILRERHFFEYRVLEFQEEFRHECPPPRPKLRSFRYQCSSTTRRSRQVMLSSPPLFLAALIKASHAAGRDSEFARID